MWWHRPGVFSVSNPRDVRPSSWMLEHDQSLALAQSLVPLWRRHFNAVCTDRWNPRHMGMSRWAEPLSRNKRKLGPPCWPRQRHIASRFPAKRFYGSKQDWLQTGTLLKEQCTLVKHKMVFGDSLTPLLYFGSYRVCSLSMSAFILYPISRSSRFW